MGKINLRGVLWGGFLAGVVLNVVDYVVYGVLLGDQMNAAMQALGKGPIGGSQIFWFVVVDFLYGFALIWSYAAIRPRFGPGPRTAVYAGLYMWVLIALLHAVAESQMGLMPQNLFVIGTLVALVLIPVAGVVGAKFYTEA